METDDYIYENGCEFYKWYYYPKWDVFAMKIDGMPRFSNIMGGAEYTMVGIKLGKNDDYKCHLNININERFVLPLTPGQKRSLKNTLNKFSTDRAMFKKFYVMLIERLFSK
jgi:hypothetical protein